MRVGPACRAFSSNGADARLSAEVEAVAFRAPSPLLLSKDRIVGGQLVSILGPPGHMVLVLELNRHCRSKVIGTVPERADVEVEVGSRRVTRVAGQGDEVSLKDV